MRLILAKSLLPRGVVVDGPRRARLVIAVEPIEHLEVGRDRLKFARVDRLGGEGLRALEPDELKQRMIRGVIDRSSPHGVADDFSHPPLAYALFARDLRSGPAQAQPGKDALPPHGLGVRVEPRPRRFWNRLSIHVGIPFSPFCGAGFENPQHSMRLFSR